MAFPPSMSSSDIHEYHRVVARSMNMRSHFDLLIWLQGDMQRYLPHHIMVASWGNFLDGAVQYDILSPLPGVRSHTTHKLTVVPLLQQLFLRWSEFGNKPFALNVGSNGFLLDSARCALGNALTHMRSAMVHGIKDARGSQECLYAMFSTEVDYSETESAAMAMALPYIDTALRQVDHLPRQAFDGAGEPANGGGDPVDPTLSQDYGLTERESEIVSWVALGKTNADIGLILGISEFTVKNHMQRIFKKLDVSNRAQAVSRLNTLLADV